MSNQITGKIIYISPTQQIPSKDGSKSFLKREIAIDATRFNPYTGERGFENFPMLEFSGEKCSELDEFQVGQVVTITFDLQGRKWVNGDGVTKYITSIRGYKIEARQAQQPVQHTQPQQPQTPYASFPPPVDVNDNTKDDLPF